MQYIGVKYLRASKDSTGRSISVGSQEDEGDDFFEVQGIEDAGTYRDNDLSASLYAKEGRPEYERALDVLRSGRANLLWTYSSSRAQRDLEVYTRLRRLLIEIGGYWAYGGRIYDMSDPADRRTTARDALEAEGHSDAISTEVVRGVRKRAKAGKHHGPIPFGYKLAYDPNTGESLGLVIHVEQAVIVREIVDRVLNRDPVSMIVGDLNREGVLCARSGKWDKRIVARLVEDHSRPVEWNRFMARLTPDQQHVAESVVVDVAAGESPKLVAKVLNRNGVPYFFSTRWDNSKVKNVARSASIAGLRIHRKVVVSKLVKSDVDGSDEMVLKPIQTQWPRIISPDEHMMVEAILNPPNAGEVRDGRRVRHLWSGIGRCGVCESPLEAKSASCGKPRRYSCRESGCVVRNQDAVDAWLLELAMQQLERADAAALFRSDESMSDAHAAQREVEALQAELEGWRKDAREGRCSRESFVEIEPGLLDRLAKAEKRAKRATLPPALVEVMGPDARSTFLTLDVTAQRTILRSIMRPRIYPTRRRMLSGLDTSTIDPGFLFSTNESEVEQATEAA